MSPARTNTKLVASFLIAVPIALTTSRARADVADEDAVVEAAPPTAPSNPAIAPVHSDERADTVIPKPAEPPPPGRTTLAAEPLFDGAIIIGATAFAGILDLINGTGEYVRSRSRRASTNRSSSESTAVRSRKTSI